MTDQIPADKVRKIASAMRAAMRRVEDDYPDGEFLMDMSDYIRDLESLLPDPPLPTLVDMTEEERRACKWMQADVANRSVRYVIAAPDDGDGEAALIGPDGKIDWRFPEYVTPRPDLPRMEWPGNEKPAPTPALPGGWRLADHPKYGRVIVTGPPNLDGRVYFVFPAADRLGYDWFFCPADELTYIDQEGDTPTGPDHLAVGTVIESADDPRLAALPDGSVLLDRHEGPVTKRPLGWAGGGYIPTPSQGETFGPWEVSYIPKEADR